MLQGDADGVAPVQVIRKRYPDVPIVLASGHAKALGARHGLPIPRKPYQIAALGRAVRDDLDTGPRGDPAAD